MKRSVSDLAMQFVNGARKDNLKDSDLQSLVRLCGKSVLCLPAEYAPGSLVLPTCFRATAQYLLQHGKRCHQLGGPDGRLEWCVLTRDRRRD